MIEPWGFYDRYKQDKANEFDQILDKIRGSLWDSLYKVHMLSKQGLLVNKREGFFGY